MARKTFISYKYSESQSTRDRIIRALGNDASYYIGETSESPDMSDLKTQTIRGKLSDMLFSSSVLIIVISPNVDKSNWIKWEINYATSRQTRSGRQSQPNGIVEVFEDRILSGGHYTPNTVTKLLEEKSEPVKVTLTNFLQNPNRYIEQAYEKMEN
ncbi:MAG: TIR domain-containing protein [Streptococcaceae bacterium]|jgi:hypothetical protein|nr:TIR domain-containing protein [Streptococcaceae bacterium]